MSVDGPLDGGASRASLGGASNGVPPSPGGAEVSASLEGLVSALDSLKQSLGYDDYSAVERLVKDLRDENAEIRGYAESAIREAQRLQES
ncbi:hypothetical protein H632_c2016p0, partial [Helicosporidium sp. ATCC 50920]